MKIPVRFCFLLLAVLAVGVPGFIEFDATGKMTHAPGLINPQSLARVGLFLFVTYALAVVFVLTSRQVALDGKRVRLAIAPFVLLFGYYFLNAVFLLRGDDFLLSVYRLLEWSVVLVLIFLIYTNQTAWKENLFLKLVQVVVVVPIVITVVGTLFLPNLAYHYSNWGDYFRFGGYLYSSNVLGVLAGIGVLLSFLYATGTKRVLGIAAFGLVLVLTHSRGALVGLFVAFVTTPLLFGYKRYLSLLSIAAAVVALMLYEDPLLDYLSRGQGVEGLLGVGGRLDAWDAAFQTFQQSPWFGTGYIVGPKRIGEIFDLLFIDHWYPRTAHNDLLQAVVSGGILAAILSLYIFVKLFANIYQLARRNIIDRQTASFYWALAAQLATFGILTPLINTSPFVLSIILALLYVEVALNTRAASAYYALPEKCA